MKPAKESKDARDVSHLKGLIRTQKTEMFDVLYRSKNPWVGSAGIGFGYLNHYSIIQHLKKTCVLHY